MNRYNYISDPSHKEHDEVENITIRWPNGGMQGYITWIRKPGEKEGKMTMRYWHENGNELNVAYSDCMSTRANEFIYTAYDCDNRAYICYHHLPHEPFI